MKSRYDLTIFASVVLFSSPSVFAHSGSDASGSSIYHYLTAPDHVIFLALAALATTLLLARTRRRKLLKHRP